MQFLQHDQLGPLGGGFTYVALQTGDVSGNIGGAMLLHHAYFDGPHYLYLEN